VRLGSGSPWAGTLPSRRRVVLMHPEDVAERGLEAGQRVGS